MTHSQTDSAADPAMPANSLPAREQYQQIHTTLQTLIGLIMPLHQLLEAQEKLDDGITSRLKEIMEALVMVSASMQTSADNLTKLTEAETLSPILNAKLESISKQQTKTEKRLTEIDSACLMTFGAFVRNKSRRSTF